MQDLISVVIPVYNCAPYLDVCLQSLADQTLPGWEALLVDDGSTDGSAALCDAWARKDARFRVLHQQNAGVSAARNAGIDAARGNYLAFLDGDDRLEPAYLQTLFTLIQQADMAVCCVYDQSDWNEKVRSETVSLQTLRTTPSRYANPVFTNYLYNKLYRMELVKPGIRFPVGVRRCEDAYFVQDCLLACRRIAVCTDKLYHYELHEGSAIHRFYAGVCEDELPLMSRQYDLFHPSELEPAEETAYRVWEYGKILAVCQYICRYAPDPALRNTYLRRWLDAAPVRQALARTPAVLGKKAALLRTLSRLGLTALCAAVACRIC